MLREFGKCHLEFPIAKDPGGFRRPRMPGFETRGCKVKLTISKEDYLKAIAEAEAEEGNVIAATIARWLSVTPPAVALALRRLRRDKLLEVDRKGHILLTKAWREVSD